MNKIHHIRPVLALALMLIVTPAFVGYIGARAVSSAGPVAEARGSQPDGQGRN